MLSICSSSGVLYSAGIWIWLMLTLSGPVELLFLLHCIAAWTCVVVLFMLVVCSLSVFLYMCVLCLTVLVNCLLNAFAICVGDMNIYCVVFVIPVCV